CALGLQTIAREQNLKMAIGITEGPIFAGPVGAPNQREYTVIGDEVNLAARLMQYGRAGTTIISERVKERAGTRFTTESLGEISVRGKTQALPAYLVKDEQIGQDELMSQYLLDEDLLIGRKAELEQTRRLANRAREGKLQLLFLEGELGLGKSRLAAEIVREWIIAGNVGYGSKSVSYGRQIPYQAWRDILIAMFGLTSSLSPPQQLARLATSLAADLADPPGQPNYWANRLPLLADVLGLAAPDNEFTRHISSELRRTNTFTVIEAILRRQAQKHPLLLLLEDGHWADELSLALTAHLVQNLVDSPILLVFIHRPIAEDEGTLFNELKEAAQASTIKLESLSEQESLDLIRMMLDNQPHLAEVEEIIMQRGQGNPFFLQEITNTLIDAFQNQETPYVQDASNSLDLPDTVQDVILSRVDRLSEDEKLTLKIASVIGARFQRLILSQVHPMENAQLRLPQQLDKLEQEKLLQLRSPAPKWEYVFRNIAAQEVVYEGLLVTQRRHLHTVVGEALEIVAPSQIDQLTYHYSRSGDWDKALYYLRRSSEKARRESANQAAIGYYSEILNCLRNRAIEQNESFISAEYWDTILERVKLYNLLGRRDEELEDLGTLGIMAEALGDDSRRAMAAKQWTYLYETSGDYDSGLELIERCLTLAEKTDDKRLIGEGYNHWGYLLYLRGRYNLATEYLQKAWTMAQQQQDQVMQADCLNNQGTVARYQADYQTALYCFQQAIGLWRVINDQAGLGNSLCNLGQTYYDMGQYASSRQCYTQALSVQRTIGDRAGEARTQQSLGKIERSLGNYNEARRLFEQSLVFYQSIDDHHQEGEEPFSQPSFRHYVDEISVHQ
ncbi:MAG: tetratricopeptide repeat protein, partial [Chloroflexota bacterium]